MLYAMFNLFKFDVIIFENELKNVYDTWECNFSK